MKSVAATTEVFDFIFDLEKHLGDLGYRNEIFEDVFAAFVELVNRLQMGSLMFRPQFFGIDMDRRGNSIYFFRDLVFEGVYSCSASKVTLVNLKLDPNSQAFQNIGMSIAA